MSSFISSSFITSDEEKLGDEFLSQGFIVRPTQNTPALEYLKKAVSPYEPEIGENLNEVKLEVMGRLNNDPAARFAYYSLAPDFLKVLVGNELAMQKKFNLNVQIPNDSKHLLPIHADTWTGDSPFQVVQWVPLVDCYKTKALWILPPEYAKNFRLSGSSEDMFKRIEPHIKYIEIKYGEVLIFNSTLPHGNRVNREDSTRWSLNCRFKSVFSPYGRKELGEHFEPITLRVVSQIGLNYRHPQ